MGNMNAWFTWAPCTLGVHGHLAWLGYMGTMHGHIAWGLLQRQCCTEMYLRLFYDSMREFCSRFARPSFESSAPVNPFGTVFRKGLHTRVSS